MIKDINAIKLREADINEIDKAGYLVNDLNAYGVLIKTPPIYLQAQREIDTWVNMVYGLGADKITNTDLSYVIHRTYGIMLSNDKRFYAENEIYVTAICITPKRLIKTTWKAITPDKFEIVEDQEV